LPVSSSVLDLSSSNIVVGTEMVYDSGLWYGFVSSRDNNELLRLEFGSSLSNVPVEYADYAGLGSPGDVKFYKESGIWYCLMGLSNTGHLLRLSYTQGLGHVPIIEDLGDLGGWGSIYGLSVVSDAVGVKALVSSFSGNFYSIVDFGSSITNSPTSSDVLSFVVWIFLKYRHR